MRKSSHSVRRRRNVKWMAKDATELELPAASFDVVFSNWLLMYLSDAEVTKLAADALRWVRAQPSSPCLHAIRIQVHLACSSFSHLRAPCAECMDRSMLSFFAQPAFVQARGVEKPLLAGMGSGWGLYGKI